MPITQHRMIRLISAANDFQSAAEFLLQLIEVNSNRVLDGELSPTDALKSIRQYSRLDLLLKSPVESQLTIASEMKHFRQNARRNERKKVKMAQKRERIRQPSPLAAANQPAIQPSLDTPMEWESTSPSDSTLPAEEELF